MTRESREVYQLNRREREKLARREEILEAAKSVFADKGFDAATVDEIAERADLSKGSIYGYFKSKEDLFASLMESEIDKLFKVVERSLEDLEHPIKTLQNLIREAFIHLDKNSAFIRIFTPERAGLTRERHPELIERVIPKFQRLIGLTAQCFKEGIRKGMIRKTDPVSAAHILFGMIHASLMRWMIEGESASLKKQAAVISSIFLDGIRT